MDRKCLGTVVYLSSVGTFQPKTVNLWHQNLEDYASVPSEDVKADIPNVVLANITLLCIYICF